jgi:predicted HicB family RNase H-like nuclease
MAVENEVVKLMLRLPPDLKAWVAEQASKNGCSQNSEIVRSVRERMERTEKPRRAPKAG